MQTGGGPETSVRAPAAPVRPLPGGSLRAAAPGLASACARRPAVGVLGASPEAAVHRIPPQAPWLRALARSARVPATRPPRGPRSAGWQSARCASLRTHTAFESTGCAPGFRSLRAAPLRVAVLALQPGARKNRRLRRSASETSGSKYRRSAIAKGIGTRRICEVTGFKPRRENSPLPPPAPPTHPLAPATNASQRLRTRRRRILVEQRSS